MFYPASSAPKEISLEFLSVDGGWIEFVLLAGEERFETRFSEVFDPLLSFKNWLEALTPGVQQAAFYYDTEGEEICWSFLQRHRDKGVLCVRNGLHHSDKKPYLLTYANRRQLVQCLYEGFLNFFHSDAYIPEEWEEQYRWERLTRLTHTTYEQLTHYLLSADRELLGNILFNEHSELATALPKAADTNERWRSFIQSVTEKTVDPISFLQHLETTGRLIPADYDAWPEAEKQALIKECLSYTASLYYGYKPEVLRSEVVEAYLKGG